MTVVEKEQRRSKRFRFHVDVDISDRRGARRGRAVDVSRHGLFVAIVDPPPNRHLVQLTVHLPAPFSTSLEAAATVTRTLAGQGVGLALFALSDEAKAKWDAFIQSLQSTTQAAPSQTPRAAGASSFFLRLKTEERLNEFLRTHVTAGGTVLFTPVLMPAGAPISVVVVHPRTQAEHALVGRVHRAVSAPPPKRLEILFDDKSAAAVASFGRFVATGEAQPPLAALPPPAPMAATPPPPLTEPPHPTSSLAPQTTLPQTVPPSMASSMASRTTEQPRSALSDDAFDVDVQVHDDVVEEDPIAWDLNASELPVLVGQVIDTPESSPSPFSSVAARLARQASELHPPIAADGADDPLERSLSIHISDGSTELPQPALTSADGAIDVSDVSGGVADDNADDVVDDVRDTGIAALFQPSEEGDPVDDVDDAGHGDDDDLDVDQLLIDDTRMALDLGLRPGLVRIACDSDHCDSEPYTVELGPCSGVLGLVANLEPFWSAEQGRVVSLPRLVSADERRARFQRYTERGGQIEDVVSLSMFLAAADLAEAPHHPSTGEPLRGSRAAERLNLAAKRVIDEDVVVPTRVKCPNCNDGHLQIDRS